MAQKTMYSGINNSPITTITSDIAANATNIPVTDITAFPTAPNIATIGTDDDAEIILYTSISGTTLSGCTRGFNGTTAKAWTSGEAIYRAFTDYDYEALKFNVENHETRMASAETGVIMKESTYDPQGYHQDVFAYVNENGRVRRYGILWDKINRKGIRLWDAANITANTTNFGHFGSVNPNISNPFNNIYPWSERKLCNYNIASFVSLVANGYDVRDAVTKWEGEEGFTFTPDAGISVGVYTPKFWHMDHDTSSGRVFGVAENEILGWTEAEATIGGRWWGVLETVEIGGVNKTVLGCRPGMPATSIAMSTLRSYAENAGMTVDDIYSFDATTMLAIVEYASMNTQEAVGSGCSSLYRQSADKIQTAAASTNVIQVLTANAGMCRLNAIIDIGTTDGGRQIANRYITAVAVDETAPTLTNVTISGDPIAVTADHFWSIHGCINIADAEIGSASGYLGTNGYCNAYYRGQVIHANLWRYILGAYREKDTGHIWVAKSRTEAEAYNALNKSVHRDTGLVLPQGADGAATSGYINKLGVTPGLSAPPFCTEGGGNSSNPVGDYYSVPTIDTVDTILLACGYAPYGANAGRFYGYWNATASSSNWTISAVPFSKSPKRGA